MISNTGSANPSRERRICIHPAVPRPESKMYAGGGRWLVHFPDLTINVAKLKTIKNLRETIATKLTRLQPGKDIVKQQG